MSIAVHKHFSDAPSFYRHEINLINTVGKPSKYFIFTKSGGLLLWFYKTHLQLIQK